MEILKNKCQNSSAKKEKKFDKEKTKFSVIIAKKDIETISKRQKNLLIDFFKRIRSASSKIKSNISYYLLTAYFPL